VGEKITLAKIATPPVLARLLAEAEPRVSQACLINPRLREEDLVSAVRQETAARSLLEAAAASSRWGERYAVRLALVLQPRTPLGVALAQISSLLDRDLERVAGTGVRPPSRRPPSAWRRVRGPLAGPPVQAHNLELAVPVR
jgi:hypothetical protein